MKILITGVNPVQCGHRPRIDYVSSVLALHQICKDTCDHVDLRPVIEPEIFDQYDKIILYLAPVRGFVAKYALGALWAWWTAGDKCVISFDDWQIPHIFTSLKSLVVQWDNIIDKDPFKYVGLDKFKEHSVMLCASAVSLAEQKIEAQILLPAYNGGDLSKLKIPAGESKFVRYNPSILFKDYYLDEAQTVLVTKKKEWVLAALHDHASWLKKQKLTWPVMQYGSKKLKQPQLKEKEIYTIYRNSVGVLSPEYNICGSGWWRARHGFAADSGAVLAGSIEELSMIGDGYDFMPNEVEQATDSELADLAELQHYQFYKAAGTRQELYDVVSTALH